MALFYGVQKKKKKSEVLPTCLFTFHSAGGSEVWTFTPSWKSSHVSRIAALTPSNILLIANAWAAAFLNVGQSWRAAGTADSLFITQKQNKLRACVATRLCIWLPSQSSLSCD